MQNLPLLIAVVFACLALLGWGALHLFARRDLKRQQLIAPAAPPRMVQSNASEVAGSKMLNALRDEAERDIIVLPNPLRPRQQGKVH